MKVLVACEFSGVVRDAFAALGHDVLSCDLLPSETPGNHYRGNVLSLIDEGWDLMIAHPPCTFLSNSGVSWLNHPKYPNRWSDMRAGAEFFKELLNAPIPRIAVENPIMHKYAVSIIGRKKDQIIHPYQFGHYEQKATCLWLNNLPLLIATSDFRAETKALPIALKQKMWWGSTTNRARLRSVTYKGVAKAMATQWGSL